jgi:exosortase
VDAPQENPTGRNGGGLGGGARIALAATAVLAAAIGWSYRSSFGYLIYRWEHDSNYTYGWLILPIVAWILWERRGTLGEVSIRPTWWGLLPMALLLAVRYQLYERNEQWVEAATIPLILGSTVLAVGGVGLLRWALPGLLYLAFILPLPPSLDTMLSGPLQTVATLGAVSVLQTVGTPVLANGNIIVIGTQELEVAEACRGLSMLLAFAALITAMVILVKRPIWERAVLLVSIVPIALLCNITRIAATAIVYAKFNRKVETAHDYAGYAMMVLALGLVMLELKIMSWLVVEEEVGTTPTLLRTSYGANPGPR